MQTLLQNTRKNSTLVRH